MLLKINIILILSGLMVFLACKKEKKDTAPASTGQNSLGSAGTNVAPYNDTIACCAYFRLRSYYTIHAKNSLTMDSVDNMACATYFPLFHLFTDASSTTQDTVKINNTSLV